MMENNLKELRGVRQKEKELLQEELKTTKAVMNAVSQPDLVGASINIPQGNVQSETMYEPIFHPMENVVTNPIEGNVDVRKVEEKDFGVEEKDLQSLFPPLKGREKWR